MLRIDKHPRVVLSLALLLPLLSMAIIPFYDTSEPRYAEIARIMAESGDWITPWFKPGYAFWGKPPLSFWAQALSLKLFGSTELAARLPSWICLLLSCSLLLTGLRILYNSRVALFATLIYSTSALVYISSGAVLTDPFLNLGTTLSLVSFAVVAHAHKPSSASTALYTSARPNVLSERALLGWQYGFFIGLAIGLLAKGPLAIVLSLTPIGVWYGLQKKQTRLAQTLPWISGLALMASISLPWYIMAEIKTPGFLRYFILGEHILRFVDPGWQGDLYGVAHKQAYGTIWLYWIQASFPWGVLLLTACAGALFKADLRGVLKQISQAPLFSYWVSSALTTPLFFTFAANILWTYVLPGMAGLSVVTAMLLDRLYPQHA